jgi:addiction module HigA family antidote
MSEMFNPVHPGRVLKNTVCREDGGMSVTEFAKWLKVSRVTLSRVLNGHAGVSAELAIRLEAALGSSAQMWVGMQSGYDLAQARKQRHPKIERLRAA